MISTSPERLLLTKKMAPPLEHLGLNMLRRNQLANIELASMPTARRALSRQRQRGAVATWLHGARVDRDAPTIDPSLVPLGVVP